MRIKIYRIIIFILFLFPITGLLAKPRIWLEVPDSFSSGNKANIIKDTGESIELGTFQTGDITSLVKDNEKALEYAKISDKNDTYGKVFFWSGLGLMISGTIIYMALWEYKTDPVTLERQVDMNAKNTKIGFTIYGVGLIGGLIFSLISQSKIITSRHYLFKSINTYNGVYSENSDRISLSRVENRNILKYNKIF